MSQSMNCTKSVTTPAADGPAAGNASGGRVSKSNVDEPAKSILINQTIEL
jgi:hypothetical protein